MSRLLGLINWTLRPDRDADAPETTHRFRCLTLKDDDTECGAEGKPVTDLKAAQDWTFAHLRENSGHTSFAEIVERPWVMWRGGRA
ncbi:hypothetical protein ACFQ67_27355 [Streptomyces sp. NPDC056488]|uniref:DUF7848 domain-containing protein n=1 Tax=Streptomyces sp. NPDC056488 TaxID=3345836 RepID=UPI003682F122